jgi:hypothetical protein
MLNFNPDEGLRISAQHDNADLRLARQHPAGRTSPPLLSRRIPYVERPWLARPPQFRKIEAWFV